MNIPPIIAAVENLDEAILATPEPAERAVLESVNKTLREALRKRGVFVGTGCTFRFSDPAQSKLSARSE